MKKALLFQLGCLLVILIVFMPLGLQWIYLNGTEGIVYFINENGIHNVTPGFLLTSILGGLSLLISIFLIFDIATRKDI